MNAGPRRGEGGQTDGTGYSGEGLELRGRQVDGRRRKADGTMLGKGRLRFRDCEEGISRDTRLPVLESSE